jgi:hypothetical protein
MTNQHREAKEATPDRIAHECRRLRHGFSPMAEGNRPVDPRPAAPAKALFCAQNAGSAGYNRPLNR